MQKKKGVGINPCLVFLNMVFGLAGVGFLGVGIWMARHPSTSCVHFLQAFSVCAGLFMVAIALAGLLGSFRRIVCLLYFNFAVMLALLLVVLATSVFVLIVTSHGIKAYVSESRQDALSQWLLRQVDRHINKCTQNGEICEVVYNAYSHSSSSNRPSLSSIQVGCCEPPNGCDNINVTTISIASDCEAWKQLGTQGFCSHCKACHDAVAENIRHIWHQVAIFKIIALLILIPSYFLSWCSFKKEENGHSHDGDCKDFLNCCFSYA